MNRYLYRYHFIAPIRHDILFRLFHIGEARGRQVQSSQWLQSFQKLLIGIFFEIHPLGYVMLQPHIVITYKTRSEVGDVGNPRSQCHTTGGSYSNSPQHH